MSPLEAENVNYLWAQLLMGECLRQGVRHVLVCPGSRSSPLAIAAARTSGLRTTVVVDERCAGFIALGIGKATGVPAVVVTTSGTAVANLLPAAVEGSMSGTPLVLLTADRPPELRECGANQSIDQRGIFGAFARFAFEWPVPCVEVDPGVAVSMASELIARARLWPPGPVHLNCPFREPLAPRAGALPDIGGRLRGWARGSAPWRVERPESGGDSHAPVAVVGRRVLVVAGAQAALAVQEAAERELPCIADLTARVGATAEAWRVRSPRGGTTALREVRTAPSIAAADLLLAALGDERLVDLRERLLPDVVIRAGGPLVSKRLGAFVSTARELVVERAVARQDDAHAATHVCGIGHVHVEPDPEYAALWRSVSVTAESAVEAAIGSGGDARTGPLTEPLIEPLIEPWIARELPRRMRTGTLVCGNSMPVRDLDAFWPSDATMATRVIANRGASGIDGTISTAVGAAIGTGGPITAVLGDLAALHDLGGLANLHSVGHPLHIVIVNNDGGAIFHFLPIASEPNAAEHFERLLGTPHGLSFERAAAMFGVEYARAATRGDAARLFGALPSSGTSMIIECVTDRATNVEAHRAIQRAVADALVLEFA